MQVDAPKVEAPKPKVEAPKPKVEAPKPKAEAPKPKVEAPKPIAPKVEAPKAVDAPKVRQCSCMAAFLHHTSVGNAAVVNDDMRTSANASNGCTCWCHAYLSGNCASELWIPAQQAWRAFLNPL